MLGTFTPFFAHIGWHQTNGVFFVNKIWSTQRILKSRRSGWKPDILPLNYMCENWSSRAESNHLPKRVNRFTACRSPLRHHDDFFINFMSGLHKSFTTSGQDLNLLHSYRCRFLIIESLTDEIGSSKTNRTFIIRVTTESPTFERQRNYDF